MSKVLLSHLAHVELITPKLNESARFFVDVMGLTEVKRTNQSVYLRCWGDYYQYSLMLTQGSQPALGHAAWRSVGAAELQEAASRVEAAAPKASGAKALRARPVVLLQGSRRAFHRASLGG